MPRHLETEGRVSPLGRCASTAADERLVETTRERMPTGTASQELADLFRMLGDANRVRILSALVASKELCVCDLAAVVNTSESTVSHALRLLRASGMVRSRRQGKRVFYALDDAHVRVLIELSAEHLAHLRGPSDSTVAAAQMMEVNS